MLNAICRLLNIPHPRRTPRGVVRGAKHNTGDLDHLGEWVSPRLPTLLDTQPTPLPDTLPRPAPDTHRT